VVKKQRGRKPIIERQPIHIGEPGVAVDWSKRDLVIKKLWNRSRVGDIADLCGVSARSIQKRAKELQLGVNRYTQPIPTLPTYDDQVKSAVAATKKFEARFTAWAKKNGFRVFDYRKQEDEA
jgi:hypothetical protein